MKCRCDDDIKIWRDGVVVIDEMVMPGWQWRDVVTVSFGDSAKLMAMQMFNQVSNLISCLNIFHKLHFSPLTCK